ncbi:MAG: hypothetical protein AB1916_06990 [Thermodesulfobacteriota bacterium]
MRLLPLLLAVLLASCLAACLRRQPAPAPAAPAAANATAAAPAAPAPAPAPAAEPEPPRGVLESDLDEPNPPGTKQKFGKRDAGKAAAKAPAGKSSAQCYTLSPKAKKKRCEPQCIPYARCRTGISSCRLGPENNSLTWYACEQKRKNTTDAPDAGMIMVLKANARRNMPTGHALVVESARPQGQDAWLLVVSHANWDTECSLETEARVLFNRKTMRAAFLSGEWKDWASDLVVAGFIRS